MIKTETYIKVSLFIMCAVLFMYNLGRALPIIEMEKFYFQSVKEMFARGDWITPYYYGQFRFAKPILFYWAASLSYILFGVNNFAVRFPSALCAIFTVLTTFSMARRLFDVKTGLLAALITATFPLFFMYARYASPDMAMTFLMTYAMYLFIRGVEDPEKNKMFFMAFFAILGLAAATKGFGGFALPLIAVIIYAVSAKKWNLFKSMNIPLGLIIMLAIGLPWYLVMYKLHGNAYLNHVITKETFGRVFYSPENKGGTAFLGPYLINFFDYVPALLAFFIPHSLFLPVALIDAFKKKGSKEFRVRDSYILVLSYFITIFAVFTLMSSKIYHYMLPISPAFGILVAVYLINLEKSGQEFRSRNFNIMYKTVIIVYAITTPVLLYVMHHLYSENVAFYDYAVILTPLILLVPYTQRKSLRTLYALPIATALFMLFLAGRALPLLNDNMLLKFSEEIKKDIKKGDRVGVGSIDVSQQRMGIYLDMPIEEINYRGKGDGVFEINRNKVINFLKSEQDAYLVITEEDYKNFIPDDLKTKIAIIDTGWTWKTRFKRGFDKQVFTEVLCGKRDLIKGVFRHKLYLIVNHRSALSS